MAVDLVTDVAVDLAADLALDLSAPLGTEDDAAIRALAPYSWLRADSVIVAGDKVAAIIDKALGGHLLTQSTVANRMVGPVPQPAIEGAPVLEMRGGQVYDSNLPASTWRFLHDGSGAEVFHIAVQWPTAPTTWATSIATIAQLLATRVGFAIYRGATGQAYDLVVNGTANVTARSPGTIPNGAASVRNYRFSLADPVQYQGSISPDGAIGSSGAVAAAPSAGDSELTLRLGGGTTAAYQGFEQWGETLIFNRVLSEAERATVRAYLARRYRIASFQQPAVSAQDQAIFDLKPYSWLRADARTDVSGKTMALTDKVRPGHVLIQGTASVRPTPVDADDQLNGKPSLTFAGAQYLDSSFAASTGLYKPLHDGTGGEILAVYVPTAAAAGGAYVVAGNRTGLNAGFLMLWYGENSHATGVTNGGSGVVIDAFGGGPPNVNAPIVQDFSYSEAGQPKYALSQLDGTVVTSGASVGAPATTNPQTSLRLGARADAGLGARMRWAETLVFDRVLSEADRQRVREYLAARYGLPLIAASAAPAAEDVQLASLKPFSWLRADSVQVAGSTVAALVDKAKAGHALTQGTVSAQCAAPAAELALNGQPALSFTGTQFYDSSGPLADWAFLHNGNGGEIVTVLVAGTAGVNSTFFSTCDVATAQPGVHSSAILSSGGFGHTVQNGATRTQTFSALAPTPQGTALYLDHSYGEGASPKMAASRNAGSPWASTSTTAAPSSAAPSNPLRIGRSHGATLPYGANLQWAETIVFDRVLSNAERRVLREYLAARYRVPLTLVVQPSDPERVIADLAPFSWLRADAIVQATAGGKVTALKDKARPGHLLTQGTASAQVAAPVADAQFSGQPVLSFEAGPWYSSNLPASAWKFLHDGSGAELVIVGTVEIGAGGSASLVGTGSAGSHNGIRLVWSAPINTATVALSLYNGGGTSNAAAAPAPNPATPTYIDLSHGSAAAPQLVASREATPIGANYAFAPGALDPAYTLQFGALLAGGVPVKARVAEVLIFNRVLSEWERQLVREYIARRYGIAAPVLEGPDRELMRVARPFSWLRADALTLVNGKVMAWTDKARPGHMLLQATASAQGLPITSDPTLGGQPAVEFSNAQFYQSTGLASAWRFLHRSAHAFYVVMRELWINWNPILATTNASAATRGMHLAGRIAGDFAGANLTWWIETAQGSTAQLGITLPNGSLPPGRSLIVAGRWPGSMAQPARLRVPPVNPAEVIALLGNVGTPDNDPSNPLVLGGSSGYGTYLRGRVAEVIVLDRYPSDAEDAAIRALLTQRYGLADGRVGHEAVPAELAAAFRALFRADKDGADAWFDAESYEVDPLTGKVLRFVDRLDREHGLVQRDPAAQVALPSPDLLAWGGAVTAPFTGTEWYVSSRARGAWRFLHDGNGMEAITALVPTATTLMATIATRAGNAVAPGFTQYLDVTTAHARSFVANDAGAGIAQYTGTATLNVLAAERPAYIDSAFGPSGLAHRVRGNLIASSAATGAASTRDPAASLWLGADSATTKRASMRWRATYLFRRVLSATERAIVQAYIEASSGPPPV